MHTDAAEGIGPGGFEPPLTDPKSAVLPLDEGPLESFGVKPSAARKGMKGSTGLADPPWTAETLAMTRSTFPAGNSGD
jgi:hypothetical protein